MTSIGKPAGMTAGTVKSSGTRVDAGIEGDEAEGTLKCSASCARTFWSIDSFAVKSTESKLFSTGNNPAKSCPNWSSNSPAGSPLFGFE